MSTRYILHMNIWIKPSKTVLEMPGISQNSLSPLIISWINKKNLSSFSLKLNATILNKNMDCTTEITALDT